MESSDSADDGSGGAAIATADRVEPTSQSQNYVAAAREAISAATSPPESTDKLDDAFRSVSLKRSQRDLTLRTVIGFGVPLLMAVQVIAIDVGFFLYGFYSGWKIPVGAIGAWLGAGVIQVVGSVTLVVAKDLFPGTGKGDDALG